jgi:leucine-rich repeat protein SHOC2
MKTAIIILSFLISIPAISQNDDYGQADETHHLEEYYKAIYHADDVTRLFIDRDVFKQIPKTIIKFRKLEKLECRINTSLTEDDILLLKSLPNLKYLDIHGEAYELPQNLGLLSNVQHLRLHIKMIKIPDCVCNMSQLKRIDLVGDVLTLPPCFAKMDSLRSLNFYFNDFIEFPEVICKIPNLDSLSFSAKSIETLPLSFKNMKLRYLKVMALKNTNVANQVFQLPDLKYLDVNQCLLNELPENIRMSEVEEVVFSGSELFYYDKMFEVFSKFKHLKAISISGGNFNILGPEISKLTSLEKLTIIHSSIKKISPEFYSLKNLKYLKLSENNILPGNDISSLSTLEYLELSDGTGNFNMESVMTLKKLKYLSLTDLGIKNIPNKIGDLTDLSELNISNNKINTIPVEIGKLQNLVILKVGQNELKKLPSEIGKLKKLEYLSVPSTYISSLPETLYDIKNIKIIIGSKNFSTTTIKKIKKTFGEDVLRFPSLPSPRL